jgi:hypothetical protein
MFIEEEDVGVRILFRVDRLNGMGCPWLAVQMREHLAREN